ncbi:CDP-glucose 4,6-dehydratase [Halosquirtibacter laminarini]|uniref:CDP-glucose 4,6-dehydratase n=1 Tax=Halosquirtibacter laminarini TaxID=3374600 RepID=A0AC61NE87_9BACT|nr:CDP-glucose 4,6-dehydratase [Prolixibacteraceae bacterium]
MINSFCEDFYKGKTVLVTGHTGFKGAWLSIVLINLGAKVVGYSLDPVDEKCIFNLSGLKSKMIDIRGDVRDINLLNTTFEKYQPEIVFHLAAQALVRDSYTSPVDTFDVNVMGTIHVMEAIRSSNSVRVSVLVTTDKCYENREHFWGYRENDPMGGHDPYSASKGACEIAIQSWRRSFFDNPNQKSISSVRAGNVIGGGDWAKDRIIPDCVNAIENGKPIEIRSPKSIRPWEHVLEPLSGYLLLAYKMWGNPQKYSGAWNFGPNLQSVVPVWDIASKVVHCFGKGEVVDISDSQQPHEAKLLALDISKTYFLLGWKPCLDIDQTIQMTIDWYKRYRHEDPFSLCTEQINYYFNETK